MKIKTLASNMTLLVLSNGAEILFSYETPVAGHDETGIAFRTTEKYSATTTKHINKYPVSYTHLTLPTTPYV